MTGKTPQYDVAILGAGLTGAALAGCLARNGAKVLILDSGTHPRFSTGESVTPYAAVLLRILSERYGVPELSLLSNFESTQERVSSHCGLNRTSGYLYHRPGMRQNPVESAQFSPGSLFQDGSHFFRQDTDSWLVNTAVAYGADIRQQQRITDVAVGEDGVTLSTGDGKGPVFRARFVVDTSGPASPLADRLELREEPTRLRHRSRSLYNHMLGVRPYEETVAAGDQRARVPWSQGTLHHLFEGGWMWVIPFDNHPRATNPLCSVGLVLDPEVHPEPGCSPEEEFRSFVARYPDLAPQFRDARPAREWTRTGTQQYSSKQTVGYRWCVTGAAAGYVDELHSCGLTASLQTVGALGWRLLDALRADDFAVERFSDVQELEQSLLDFNDSLVAAAFTSTADWELWDSWFQVWSLGQLLGLLDARLALSKYAENHRAEELAGLERCAPAGGMPDYPPLRELFTRAERLVRDVRTGDRDPRESGLELMRVLRSADFTPPGYGFGEPGRRHHGMSPAQTLTTLRWARSSRVPGEIGALTYEGLTALLRDRVSRKDVALKDQLTHAVAGLPLVGRPLRVSGPK
ncbi:NAD(P)/FAD-dependent oxidoreductase [Streptomyces armeniacus]|nr:FAD-dependent oxidoreductase [Streptomyces armeniacus]AZY91993.1 Ams8 [Streptomyces armeniacus]